MMYAADVKFVFTDNLTRAVEYTAAQFKQLAETLQAVRYPLHCVCRDDATATEDQYAGPFDSHDDAHEHLRDRADVVRRCRQLCPSDVVVDHVDLIGLPLRELIETIDEIATSTRSGLPECAWYLADQQIVFVDGDDGTLPTAANYCEWVDTHLRIDAYVCEGDE
jgi:hypothetical protein